MQVPDLEAAEAQLRAAKGHPFLFYSLKNPTEFKALEAIYRDLSRGKEGSYANDVHVLAEEPLNKLPVLAGSPLCGNLVSNRFGDVFEDAQLYSKFLIGPPPGPIALDRLLGPNATSQAFSVETLEDKKALLAEAKAIARSARVSDRIISRIAVVLDELLMNAFLDAPGANGAAETPRPVNLAVGFDEGKLALLVEDAYGSLARRRLLEYLILSPDQAAKSPVRDATGAGVGLATSYQTGCSLYFGVTAGERTSAVALFPRAENVRALKKQFRFLRTRF